MEINMGGIKQEKNKVGSAFIKTKDFIGSPKTRNLAHTSTNLLFSRRLLSTFPKQKAL